MIGTHRGDRGGGGSGNAGSRAGRVEGGDVVQHLTAGDCCAVGAGVLLGQLGGKGRQDVLEHRAVAGCTSENYLLADEEYSAHSVSAQK